MFPSIFELIMMSDLWHDSWLLSSTYFSLCTSNGFLSNPIEGESSLSIPMTLANVLVFLFSESYSFLKGSRSSLFWESDKAAPPLLDLKLESFLSIYAGLNKVRRPSFFPMRSLEQRLSSLIRGCSRTGEPSPRETSKFTFCSSDIYSIIISIT